MTVAVDISLKQGELVCVRSVDGPAGRLKATEAAVTRFRTELEGSRDYALAGRLSLRPSVEVGLRHDSGGRVPPFTFLPRPTPAGASTLRRLLDGEAYDAVSI